MSETIYSARWFGPTLIERGKDQTISVSIEREGSAPTISSGTLTLYRPGGSVLVDAVAGTVSPAGTFNSATIAAATTASEALAARWLVQVDLVIGGKTYTFYNDACLAKARLYPPIGQTDLTDRHTDAAALLGTGVTSLQKYISAAFRSILVSLYSDSVPFWKWRTPSALREVLVAKSFELLFFDYSTLMAGNDRYAAFAQHYADQFEIEYLKLKSMIDTEESNILDEEVAAAAPVIQLSAGARRYRRGRK